MVNNKLDKFKKFVIDLTKPRLAEGAIQYAICEYKNPNVHKDFLDHAMQGNLFHIKRLFNLGISFDSDLIEYTLSATMRTKKIDAFSFLLDSADSNRIDYHRMLAFAVSCSIQPVELLLDKINNTKHKQLINLIGFTLRESTVKDDSELFFKILDLAQVKYGIKTTDVIDDALYNKIYIDDSIKIAKGLVVRNYDVLSWFKNNMKKLEHLKSNTRQVSLYYDTLTEKDEIEQSMGKPKESKTRSFKI